MYHIDVAVSLPGRLPAGLCKELRSVQGETVEDASGTRPFLQILSCETRPRPSLGPGSHPHVYCPARSARDLGGLMTCHCVAKWMRLERTKRTVRQRGHIAERCGSADRACLGVIESVRPVRALH
eukprot:gene22957-biopygen23778